MGTEKVLCQEQRRDTNVLSFCRCWKVLRDCHHGDQNTSNQASSLIWLGLVPGTSALHSIEMFSQRLPDYSSEHAQKLNRNRLTVHCTTSVTKA